MTGRSEPKTRSSQGRVLDLVFGGIDTSAVIALDGEQLLASENMHRSYRVDVTRAVSDGATHELSVSIESPWIAAERHRDRLGDLPNTYDTPYNFLRTMACSFGWDWGPTVPGAALWRPVFLERWTCGPAGRGAAAGARMAQRDGRGHRWTRSAVCGRVAARVGLGSRGDPHRPRWPRGRRALDAHSRPAERRGGCRRRERGVVVATHPGGAGPI